MESRICGRHKGFSLVEIAVVLLLFGVAAAYMVISPNVAKQTAKHEAERVVAYLYKKMDKADKINTNFSLDVRDYVIKTNWYAHGDTDGDGDDCQATAGCKYEPNFENRTCEYLSEYRRFSIGGISGHITVHGADGEKYDVFIAGQEGRIRIAPHS